MVLVEFLDYWRRYLILIEISRIAIFNDALRSIKIFRHYDTAIYNAVRSVVCDLCAFSSTINVHQSVDIYWPFKCTSFSFRSFTPSVVILLYNSFIVLNLVSKLIFLTNPSSSRFYC